jgi:RNA polymerase subunit RPABC4/transcription elongation factor Spt4
MQKEMDHVTGGAKMACSACGAVISLDDEKCPKCGAVFEDEEHICGNCGQIISEKDTKCPKCSTKLRSPNQIEKEQVKKKSDPDLKKLKKKVDMSGKMKCKNCGTVFLEKEEKCPQCGK